MVKTFSFFLSSFFSSCIFVGLSWARFLTFLSVRHCILHVSMSNHANLPCPCRRPYCFVSASIFLFMNNRIFNLLLNLWVLLKLWSTGGRIFLIPFNRYCLQKPGIAFLLISMLLFGASRCMIFMFLRIVMSQRFRSCNLLLKPLKSSLIALIPQ